MNGNLFDSEESYIKALRIKPSPKDQVMQERLGLVYAKRKAWKDARIVFQKCCKNLLSVEHPPSTTAWLYLGISCLRLGDFTAAEDALTQANILDNLNPRIWGWMTILSLTSTHNGGRKV
jgi:Flp pilus assembly protein TadD